MARSPPPRRRVPRLAREPRRARDRTLARGSDRVENFAADADPLEFDASVGGRYREDFVHAQDSARFPANTGRHPHRRARLALESAEHEPRGREGREPERAHEPLYGGSRLAPIDPTIVGFTLLVVAGLRRVLRKTFRHAVDHAR